MEVIGEKINTTRKSVQQAVQDRNIDFIQDLARKQADAGATYLDVNSGLALYPEEEAADFEWLVPTIQQVVDIPLVLDSGRQLPLETALKLHRGKAIINSVNGDSQSMETIFPLVKKYECSAIALTSNKKSGIPATSQGRIKIAEEIANQCQKYEIALDKIYFDPLVLPLSTDGKNGLIFIDTLRQLKTEFPEAKTISGLSNISFGLPVRKVVNLAFLVLSIKAGMDAAILDPTSKGVMAMIRATEALMDKDAFCGQYLIAFREGKLNF